MPTFDQQEPEDNAKRPVGQGLPGMPPPPPMGSAADLAKILGLKAEDIGYLPVEIKTIGQLVDELTIINIKIWMLIDKVMAGKATTEEAQLVQKHNKIRNEIVRAIDHRLGQRDIGAKEYKDG